MCLGVVLICFPARALRAQGLLLADGAPTGPQWGGETLFDRSTKFFFTKTAVTPERNWVLLPILDISEKEL